MLVVAIAFAIEYLVSLTTVLVAPLLGFVFMLAASFKICGRKFRKFRWENIILAAIVAVVFLWAMSTPWIKWFILILFALFAVAILFGKRLLRGTKNIYDKVKAKTNQALAVLAVIAFWLVI